MNVIQEKIYRQLQKLIAFKQANEAKLAENALVLQMFTDMEGIYTAVTELLAQQDRTGKALTEKKTATIDALIDICVDCHDFLASYGNYKGFVVFSNIEGCKRTQLKRSRDEEVIVTARKLKAIMEEYPDETTESGVSAEKKTAFDNAIDAAQDVVEIPQEFRRSQHEVTLKIDAKLDDARRIYNDAMKDHMRTKYEDSDPDLYSAFVQAADVDAIAKRQRALQGTITKANGEPMRNVRVSVDGQKPVIKGGKKGGYFFQNLTPGQHELVFSRKAYQTVKHTIIIEPDHCLQLDVVMHLIEIEEAAEI